MEISDRAPISNNTDFNGSRHWINLSGSNWRLVCYTLGKGMDDEFL